MWVAKMFFQMEFTWCATSNMHAELRYLFISWMQRDGRQAVTPQS